MTTKKRRADNWRADARHALISITFYKTNGSGFYLVTKILQFASGRAEIVQQILLKTTPAFGRTEFEKKYRR